MESVLNAIIDTNRNDCNRAKLVIKFLQEFPTYDVNAPMTALSACNKSMLYNAAVFWKSPELTRYLVDNYDNLNMFSDGGLWPLYLGIQSQCCAAIILSRNFRINDIDLIGFRMFVDNVVIMDIHYDILEYLLCIMPIENPHVPSNKVQTELYKRYLENPRMVRYECRRKNGLNVRDSIAAWALFLLVREGLLCVCKK